MPVGCDRKHRDSGHTDPQRSLRHAWARVCCLLRRMTVPMSMSVTVPLARGCASCSFYGTSPAGQHLKASMTTLPLTLWMGSTTTATALLFSASKLCRPPPQVQSLTGSQQGWCASMTVPIALDRHAGAHTAREPARGALSWVGLCRCADKMHVGHHASILLCSARLCQGPGRSKTELVGAGAWPLHRAAMGAGTDLLGVDVHA